MGEPLDSIRFRREAKRCRELAEQVYSAAIQRELETVALQYEALAKQAETLAASRPRYP
jgi:hypothetical protein